MSIYIAPAAMGLGDLVVSLPVVQSLIQQGESVYLVVRLMEHLPLARRIPGLAGVVLEWELDQRRLRTDDVFYDLRDHYLQRRYWWGSREFEQAYPGYKINDILSIICADLGLEVQFEPLRRLNSEPQEQLRETVVFVPGSAIAAKSWARESWLELSRDLQEQRLQVAVVGEPGNSPAVADLLDHGLAHIETPTLADALDVLSACRAVVSVDTGLMHIAVHQSVPTVGIFRRDPVYVRRLPQFQELIAGKPCADACYRAESQSFHHHKPFAGPNFQPLNWSCQTQDGGNCLATIVPQQVLSCLESLLATRV